MSTVDVNSVIVTGENSVIRLNNDDNDAFTTHASFWRILTSPAGSGDVVYLKSELTQGRWRIWRALVEADIGRWKRVIGHGLRSQTDERQAAEVSIAVDVLNRMLELGRPSYVRIA